MSYVLLPGRHHLLTRFQADYLREHAAGRTVVFAITSADHGATRRNPVPGHRREAMVERFCAAEGIDGLSFLIDDVPPTEHYARYLTSSIAAAGGPELDPTTTVLACSTPAVRALFDGWELLDVELGTDAPRPWDLLERVVQEGLDAVDGDVHPATTELWRRYGLEDVVRTIHADPLLSGEGELTETRDYRTYGQDFDQGAARKWAELKPWVVPGRLVDVGCGVGSLLEQVAQDPAFAESDLYGIEAARPLYEECLNRRRAGVFSANPNTFFFQRNLLAGPLFQEGTIDTTTTVALCHELDSYLGPGALEQAARGIFQSTRPGGVWLTLDVVGPRGGDRPVLLRFADAPGGFEALPEPTREQLEQLTPARNLVQFTQDLRAAEGDPRPDVTWDGATAALSLRDAMEWLTRKDYTDNWRSEMHERFCTRSLDDWRTLVTDAGFPLGAASSAWTNPWLAEHRFAPACDLRDAASGERLPWPETHVLVVAEKPRA